MRQRFVLDPDREVQKTTHLPQSNFVLILGGRDKTFRNLTVLGDKGVIGGVERDEPVPLGIQPEQRGGGAEGGGEAGGPHRGARGGAADDVNVPEGAHGGGGARDGGGELGALGVGRVGGEVEQVLVPGVVDGQQQPQEPPPVPAPAREEVGEGRRRRGSPAHVGGRREAREERGGGREARERGEEEHQRDEGDGYEREQPLVRSPHRLLPAGLRKQQQQSKQDARAQQQQASRSEELD